MGLFDVWSSWSDWISDWWDAFNDKIEDIKARLWGWVDEIAKYWVRRADEFFDILRHTWSDVENLVEGAKSYADDIVSDAILKIDKWIGVFGETVAELWDKLEPYFSNVITPIQNAIDSIQNIKLPSLEDIINTVRVTVDNILNWDLPLINQSISDLWNEATKVWTHIWEDLEPRLQNAELDITNLWDTFAQIPSHVWNAIVGGWDAITDFLFEQGQRFVEKLLDVEVGLDDVVEELKRKYGGGEK